VVKAPSLVTDDGVVLMDSTLILDHIERIAPRSLMPKDVRAHARALRLVGLALAACEKNVQIVYERNLRPPEKHHQPWLDRVSGQLLAAWRPLEEAAAGGQFHASADMLQADITVAIAWTFAQSTVPQTVTAAAHPALAAFSAEAEKLPAFRETYMDFKT
jgi:glutathione S-transferase